MSRELTAAALARDALPQIPVLIHVQPGVSATPLQRLLQARGVAVLASARAGESMRIGALLPRASAPSLAGELAARPEVAFVERVHHLGFFNDRSAGTVQSGMQGIAAGATPIWDHGLHGEGQIVGLIDTGVDVDACWFHDAQSATKLPKINTWSASGGYATQVDASHSKVIAYDFLFSCDQFPSERGCEMPADASAWDTVGHGTHCAGSMTGNRSSGGNNGMAPAAKLVVQDGGATTNSCSDLPGLGCPAVDLYPMFEQAYAQGVRVHNNSYGDNEDLPPPELSNYSARSQDVDRFVWDHKDMLIVFAAGNAGMNDTDFSVSSPSTNKNGLSAGSVRATPTSGDNDLSSFSARGWSSDGRVKPDLVAPGCTASAGSDRDVSSGNCSEDSGCGTSYAAPIVVGAAALVRQYFSDGFYPTGAKTASDAVMPSAALVKAMMINGAVAVTGKDNAGQSITPIPSNEQGWGRVQLDRSLVFSGATRNLFVDDEHVGFASAMDAALEYTFTGVASSEPFKVTLVWTDYPGSVDAAPAAPKVDDFASLNPTQLVNDLDLAVSDATQTLLGNAFAGGTSMPGGNADRRNNVEQVVIAQPEAGDMTIHVTPSTIAHASQDFALVVTGQWDSANRKLPPALDAGVPHAGGMQPGASPDAGHSAGVPAIGVGSGGAASMDTMALPQAGAPAVAPPPSMPILDEAPSKHRSGCSVSAAGAGANDLAWPWALVAVGACRAARRRIACARLITRSTRGRVSCDSGCRRCRSPHTGGRVRSATDENLD
jgi:hypothetical protein